MLARFTLTLFPMLDYTHPALAALPAPVQRLARRRFARQGSFARSRPRHLQDDLRTYGLHRYRSLLPLSVSGAWTHYTLRRPDTTWRGPLVHFLVAWSRRDGRTYYAGDPDMPCFHVGMQCYAWLDLLGPRLVVGFEVLRLDAHRHEMEISYLDGGLFRGTQVIAFRAVAGGTEVEHLSYYHSGHWWLDRWLYPWIHHRIVAEHHRQMQAELAGS